MRTVFGSVTLVNVGHNFILIGADQAPDLTALTARLREREIASVPASGATLDRYVDDAHVLTDDFAPVDQLLR